MPLILQPDFGQTMLITIVWCGLFFVAGLHWFWVWASAAPACSGIFAAYHFLPHVRARIDRFLDPQSSGDTFQVDTAMESFVRGGWLGQGPGEGTVKRILPDAHTDFIFAVTARSSASSSASRCSRSSPSSCCAALSLAAPQRGHRSAGLPRPGW